MHALRRTTLTPSALALAALAFAARAVAAPAPPRSPIDAKVAALAREVVKAGQSPRGALPLLELWEKWDEASPALVKDELQRLAADHRLSPARRVQAQTLLAQARLRMGEAAAVAAPLQALGFVTRFRVIGPFDNEGKSGFDRETPPEQKRMEAPDLQAQYEGRERPVAWRELPDIVRSGYVPLGALLRPYENVCALAETFIVSPRAQALGLWVGAGGALKVYWNGELVLRDPAYRRPSPDRSVVMVGARAGSNRLLLKVCTTSGALGFQLRLGDSRGAPATGLHVETTRSDALDIPRGHAGPRLPATPATPLSYFEAEAAKEPASAASLARLARYLSLTGSDDPAERRAKQLAARAAELEPTAAHLLLAAELAEERAEVMRFADQAFARFPSDPAVRLLRASLLASGPAPEDALPILRDLPKESEQGAAASLLHANVLRGLELPQSALAKVQQLLARAPETGAALRLLAELSEEVGYAGDALSARERLLALRFDDGDARRELIDDALARGDGAAVQGHLDALRATTPGSVRTLLYLASTYDALGRDDLALATYRQAAEITPEAEGIYVAYARALLRAQQDDAARDALQKALSLKPQDAQARELLEQLRPTVRSDEAYAIAPEELRRRATQANGYPYSVLQDLTVKTVFDNGLGSTFRQLAVQIHDDAGARQFRTHSFQYDPDTQHVELRLSRVYRAGGRVLESVRTYEQPLGEPWYRLYYDTRAVVVVFPDLEPGDVVEVRYRVDDVAHRNLFADYFGDVHLWSEPVPVVGAQYVLITPLAREIVASEPAAGVVHTRAIEKDRRIDRYTVVRLPALVGEDGMPGATELGPYLHVSTYRSWQDVGRWYWGLIKDQLYADAELRRTVAELIAGASGTREKATRIHAWALSHTRYVGLEFGIHGFLPYRVPLVVQRGFGDCKDKASLMYTMLREAGVDARIVLVRTRRNGAIASSPASLAVFDHAITYVPELDLYLDGTAEHSGPGELPPQDQGVMVLLVGPDGAELRTTPVLPAEDNRRTRTLSVQLRDDGSAEIDAHEEIAGAEAADYRETYEAKGTRAERLERALGALYPGVTLQSQEFESLTSLQEPVRYRYRAQVPRFAQREGDGLQLAPSVVGDLVRSLARTPTRARPLDLGGKSLYVEERTVQLPATLRLRAPPPGGEAVSPFGKLTLRWTADKSVLHARTELRLLRDRIPPAEYPELRRWAVAADQLLRQRASLHVVSP